MLRSCSPDTQRPPHGLPIRIWCESRWFCHQPSHGTDTIQYHNQDKSKRWHNAEHVPLAPICIPKCKNSRDHGENVCHPPVIGTKILVPLSHSLFHCSFRMRRPYDASKLNGAGPSWVSRGYACIWQDQRGRFGSNGNYSFWRFGSTDAADTIAWVVAQPWSNGKVATMGGSADGIAQCV